MNEKRATKPNPLRHIPNALTWSRLCLAIAFPFSPESWHLLIILLALISEFLDGFIARLFHWTSYFGQVLDPIADKVFFLAVCLTWVWMEKLTLPHWLLLSTRDFGVLFIVIALAATGRIRDVRSVKAQLPSKITTALQYAVVIALLVQLHQAVAPLVYAAATIGVLATLQYMYLLWKDNR